MNDSNSRKILALSLALNAFGLAGIARTIYNRGGWEYLKDRFAGMPEKNRLNPDAANYSHRQSLFERLPVQENRIVFVGDSLTQGGEWAEFYPGALNRGIGGDTSAGILKRIGSITALRPRAIFLMIGSNDLYNIGLSPKQTIANIHAVLAEIRSSSPATVVYLESNLPTWDARQNIHGRAVNDGLASLADGRAVVYVDLYRAFLQGEVLDPKFTADGGHLNGSGYLVWKHYIDPFVGQLKSEAGD